MIVAPRMLSLAAVAALSVLNGCICSDKVVHRVTSPDGLLIATYYVRNCGATEDFVSTVNLQSARSRFNRSDGVLFVATGEHRIALEWSADRHLHVVCDTCKHDLIYRQVVRFGSTDVDFALPQ